MGFFDFIKDAGEKVFGKDDDEPVVTKSLSQHLRDHGIDPENVDFKFAADGTVTVSGAVESQELREKIVTIVGNVQGVAKVEDQINIAAAAAVGNTEADTGEGSVEAAGEAPAAEWESRTYTVESGDTLWKIATEMYGDGSKYTKIFEANTPMLKDPDKIYPGQVLRIPNLG